MMSEPQRHLTADDLEVVEGTEHHRIEGWVPELASETDLREALEHAFDYRGDVTITRKNGERIDGYIFDRRPAATLAESVVRVIPQNSREKISIPYSDIAALAFTDAIPPPAKAGKPGSASIGRRKRQARKESRWSRKSWSRRLVRIRARPWSCRKGFLRIPASAAAMFIRTT